MFPISKFNDNPISSVTEIQLNAGADGEFVNTTSVFAELRFSSELIDTDNFSFECGIKAATLYIEYSGCEVTPGSRLNDDAPPPAQQKTTSKLQSSRNAEGELSASASYNIAGPTAANVASTAGVSSQFSHQSEVIRETTHTENFVLCKSGDRWVVKNPADDPSFLDGTFIKNDLLCKIEISEGANAVDFSCVISVRKRDLFLSPQGSKLQKNYRKTLQKSKMAEAVILKCIAKKTGQYNNLLSFGSIILGSSRLSSEETDV